jgi:hypothetical protein
MYYREIKIIYKRTNKESATFSKADNVGYDSYLLACVKSGAADSFSHRDNLLLNPTFSLSQMSNENLF